MGKGSGPENGTGSDLDRKYPVALALYGVLALLVWFTIGEDRILVGSTLVQMRWIPLLVIGGLVFRTVVAHHAEKIRRDESRGGTSTP